MKFTPTTPGTTLRVNVTVIAMIVGVIIGLMLFFSGLHSARYPRLKVAFRASGSAEAGMPAELHPEVTRSKASRALGVGRMLLGAGICIYVLRQAWNSRRRAFSWGQTGDRDRRSSDEPAPGGSS